MRLVVKVGSSILSHPDGGLDRSSVERVAKQLSAAHHQGHEIILVSSGAIAAGVGRLNLRERPTELSMKQAAASVGQLALMEAYEEAFSQDRITPAQLLLTRDDLADQERYLNVRHTLLKLLSLKTIPIINENDSVSTEEIQVGDNDTLSALVATKVEADKLILLSDVPGLYEWGKDGKVSEQVVREVPSVTADMEKQASRDQGSKMSVGGIATKILAAKLATAQGIETWIASGKESDVIAKILEGRTDAGTRFRAQKV